MGQGGRANRAALSEMQPIVPARIGGDHRFGGGDDRAGGAEVARERDDGALAHTVLLGGWSAACEAWVLRRSSEREGKHLSHLESLEDVRL